jgi:transcriptional regulator with XRE-family HTH domain
MNFGEKLKRLRKKTGKSQMQVVKELAEMVPSELRLSQTTLSVLENRETAPREEILDILSRYYNVPITYFFESDERNRVHDALKYLNDLQKRDFSERVGAFSHTDPNDLLDT